MRLFTLLRLLIRLLMEVRVRHSQFNVQLIIDQAMPNSSILIAKSNLSISQRKKSFEKETRITS